MESSKVGQLSQGQLWNVIVTETLSAETLTHGSWQVQNQCLYGHAAPVRDSYFHCSMQFFKLLLPHLSRGDRCFESTPCWVHPCAGFCVLCLCHPAERCSSDLTRRAVVQEHKGIEIKVRQLDKMSVAAILLKILQGSCSQPISTSGVFDSIFKSILVVHILSKIGSNVMVG